MRRTIAILAILTLTMTGCEDDKSIIPDSAVYIERDTRVDPDALILRTPGGYDKITSVKKQTDRIGYGGILIYHGLNDQMYAFDLACPKEVKRSVKVVPDSLVTGEAICPVCGSVFTVAYGSGNRIAGDAPEGLRRYRVQGNYMAVIIVTMD